MSQTIFNLPIIGDDLRVCGSATANRRPKINKIKGTNKPIKILSSAKYLSSDSNELLCKEGSKLSPNINSLAIKKEILKLKTPTSSLDDLILKERTKYYLNEKGLSKLQKKETINNFERSVNDNIYSTSSLLLFNTAEHV